MAGSGDRFLFLRFFLFAFPSFSLSQDVMCLFFPCCITERVFFFVVNQLTSNNKTHTHTGLKKKKKETRIRTTLENCLFFFLLLLTNAHSAVITVRVNDRSVTSLVAVIRRVRVSHTNSPACGPRCARFPSGKRGKKRSQSLRKEIVVFQVLRELHRLFFFMPWNNSGISPHSLFLATSPLLSFSLSSSLFGFK